MKKKFENVKKYVVIGLILCLVIQIPLLHNMYFVNAESEWKKEVIPIENTTISSTSSAIIEAEEQKDSILRETIPTWDSLRNLTNAGVATFITGVDLRTSGGDVLTKRETDGTIRLLDESKPLQREMDYMLGFSYQLDGVDCTNVSTKYFTFTLPAVLTMKDQTIPLKIDDINTNGYVLIKASKDGSTAHEGAVVFNQNAESSGGMDGIFGIAASFGKYAGSANGEVEVPIQTSSTYKMHLKLPPYNETIEITANKEVNTKYNPATREIKWAINFTAKAEPDFLEIKNILVEDSLPQGCTLTGDPMITCGGIAITSLEQPIFTKTTDSLGVETLKWEFENRLQAKKEYKIVFTTTVSDAFIKANASSANVAIVNKANITYNSPDHVNPIKLEPSATETIPFTFLEKSGTEKGGFGAKSIAWTIGVNKSCFEMTEAKVVDTLPNGVELNESTIKVNDVSMAKDTNQVPYYTITGQTITFNLGDISEEQKITYETKVTELGAYESNDKKTFTNQAKLTTTNGFQIEKGIGVGVSTSVIAKFATGYDKKTHQITWNIVVNQNKINMTQPKIVDEVVGSDQKIVSGSVKLIKLENSSSTTGKITFNTEYTDTSATIKDLNFSGRDSSEKNNIKGEILHFEIKTEVTDPAFWANNVTDQVFENKASLYQSGNSTATATTTGSKKYSSQVLSKKVSYDYARRRILWTITVNQNEMEMHHAVIKDKISADQIFDQSSFQVKPAIADFTDKLFFSGTDNKEVSIALPDVITDTYTITYETYLDETFFEENQGGNSITASNQANLVNDEYPTGVSVGQNIKISSSIISKSGNYLKDSNLIDWTVLINKNLIKVPAPTLTDELPSDLILDTDSIQIYHVLVNKDTGELTKGELLEKENYSYTYQNNIFELSFKDNIEEAYQLTFTTDIEDTGKTSTTKITNKIKLKGSSIEETGSSNEISYQYSNNWGTSNRRKGTITINKVASDTKKAMKDVEFALYKKQDVMEQTTPIPIKTGKTDKDGRLIFKDLNLNKAYILKEVQAPEDYILAEDYEFTLTTAGTDTKPNSQYQEITIENEPVIYGSILVNKINEEKESLKDVHFMLKKENGEFITTLITDQNGKLKFEHLPEGNYILEEVQAPEGYYKMEPLSFTVQKTDEEGTLYIETTCVNKKMPDPTGVITIKKKDEDTSIDGEDIWLANAMFVLLDQDGNTQASGVTDDTGTLVLENIPIGNYQLKEVKAPLGYELSEQIDSIVISKNVESLNQKIIRKNHRKLGDINIQKIDEETKEELEGAVFVVWDKKEDKIISLEATTRKDGKISIENLPIERELILKEIKAPEGYEIGKEILFCIKETDEDKALSLNIVVKNKRKSIIIPTLEPTVSPEVTVEPTLEPIVEPTWEPSTTETPIQNPDNILPVVTVQPSMTPKPSMTPEPSISPKPEETIIPAATKFPQALQDKTDNKTPKTGKIEVREGSIPTIGVEPSHGTVALSPDGIWIYESNPDFVGKDSFMIQVENTDGMIEEFIIEIFVSEVPFGPANPGVIDEIQLNSDIPAQGILAQKEADLKERDSDYVDGTEHKLPKTGTLPTLLFYTIGGICIVSGYGLVRKKKEK